MNKPTEVAASVMLGAAVALGSLDPHSATIPHAPHEPAIVEVHRPPTVALSSNASVLCDVSIASNARIRW